MAIDRLTRAEQALRDANPVPPESAWHASREPHARQALADITARPRRAALRRARRAGVPVVAVAAAGAALFAGIRAADHSPPVPEVSAPALPAPVFSVLAREDAPFDPGPFARGLDLRPGTGRLAYSDASGTYAVAQNNSGDVCLVFIAAGQGPGFAACEPPYALSERAWIVSHASGQGLEPRTIGLVPDGVTSVELPGGGTAHVRSNVFSIENGGTPPAELVLRGPAGEWTVHVGPP